MMHGSHTDRSHASDNSWQRSCQELFAAVSSLGLPQEFGQLLAQELKGEKSMQRMCAYLREVRPTSLEQIADELIAITSERDLWIERKRTEEANHHYYEMQRRGFGAEDEDGFGLDGVDEDDAD
ncbi:MAG: hypothetical protein ACOX4F_08570 [Atopobiaceae bacterium]